MSAEFDRLVSEVADRFIHDTCYGAVATALWPAVKARTQHLKRHEDYFAALFKALGPFEDEWKGLLREIWDEERRIILANLKKSKRWTVKLDLGDIDSILYAKQEFIKKLSKEAKKIASALIAQQGQTLLNGLDVDIVFDINAESVQQWLDSYSIELSGNLEQVNTDELKALLKAAIKNGDTIPEIMAQINDIFEEWNQYRAEVISRTETSRANNQAAKESYEQSGVIEKVEWLTAPGCCVRPPTGGSPGAVYCDELDGKVVELGEDFFSANYGSGDSPPAHPNCRCTILPVVE